MNNKQSIILILLMILFLITLEAQDSKANLSRRYRNIELGMSPGEVKEFLSSDAWFNYRGDASVSLLERPRATVIDAGGSLFLSRGLFQFENEILIAIILELNPETMDWYTVYTTLEDKYGSPLELDPTKAWWDDGVTRVALERPLTVKYLDIQAFNMAITEEHDRISWREIARKEFLDEF